MTAKVPAPANPTYLALMIHDLIDAGKSFNEIVELVEEKIRTLHTLFVLDSLDNLVKNGRISKAVALLANVLSIRLLMSDDGAGSIEEYQQGTRHQGRAHADGLEACRKQTEGLAAASRRLGAFLLQLSGTRPAGEGDDSWKAPCHRRNRHDADLRALLACTPTTAGIVIAY